MREHCPPLPSVSLIYVQLLTLPRMFSLRTRIVPYLENPGLLPAFPGEMYLMLGWKNSKGLFKNKVAILKLGKVVSEERESVSQ